MHEKGRDWTKEAERFISDRYSLICNQPISIRPPLHDLEAQYFLRGFEAGFFSIDQSGYVQSTMLPGPSGKNTKQKMMQLTWRVPRGWTLFREGVCQLATVSSLILRYGWRKEDISLEPTKREFKGLAYGVDILIRDGSSQRICGEVKRDRSEFRRLVEGFRHCCREGSEHQKGQCKFHRNHSKYEFCKEFKPDYFFAVAPGEQICFKMAGLNIEQELPDLIYRDARV